jgi:serine/threonine protein kinase
MEKLREEAHAMERLSHKHILKLVGTYTVRRNELYILLYPVAVCDLSRFLDDVDDIRTGTCADQEDAYLRLGALELTGVGTIEDLPLLRSPSQQPNAVPRTATALGFLQQTLGCITEAVTYVHGQGIRHRDLKPKNILLSPGRVYLADFGIARDVRETDDSITCTRQGTLSWLAPEVHDEEDHHMSPADVWSLGFIFLNVATILYSQSLDEFEKIMKEREWDRKYEMLKKYLLDLGTKATMAALENHDEPSFNVKHLVGLIDLMLKRKPEERPTTRQVNERLCELGGLDQIYHLSCCHKKNDYLSKVIRKFIKSLILHLLIGHLDNKFKSVCEGNANSAATIAQLRVEKIEKQKRIDELELSNSTWQTRIDKERKHAGDQYKVLQEKYNREVEIRKGLEETLRAMEARSKNRPRSQNRGRGRGYGFLHLTGNTHPMPNANGKQQQNQNLGLDTAVGNFQRRTSRVPLPIRPSTPIQIRPTMNRDPGSSSSTLISSVHSTFSQRSERTNESASSVTSSTIRSTSPGSPTTARPTVSPVMDMKPPSSPTLTTGKVNARVETKGVNHVTKPSWASLVARSTSNMI